MPPDVLIVGAGPAGTVAAVVLARAGVRVTLLDRARFPRHKLCGDTLNPGALRALGELGLDGVACDGLPLAGIRLTGPGGASVEGHYPAGETGVALARRELDQRLLGAALEAGADLEEEVTARVPIVDSSDKSGRVTGVVARLASGRMVPMRAAVTIAADGHASRLVSALGMARRPPAPRRWAIGAYYDGVAGMTRLGEMHVRGGHYVGVAPLPGGVTNAILVLPLDDARRGLGRVEEPALARLQPRPGPLGEGRPGPLRERAPLPRLLGEALAHDAILAPRFEGARPVTAPVILGPLAVDVSGTPPTGLLLAGDAAGFIDPMTGDGMRFAIAGAVLAAHAALRALEHGWEGVGEGLMRERRRAFGLKWRFNRAVRAFSGSPLAVTGAARFAPFAEPLLRRIVCYAGDAG